LRTAVGLTFLFPLVRRGLGPAGTARTPGTARCSAPGWTTGGVRKIHAEARLTVRPALRASPANGFRAAAFAATSTGTFVAPLRLRTKLAMPGFIFTNDDEGPKEYQRKGGLASARQATRQSAITATASAASRNSMITAASLCSKRSAARSRSWRTGPRPGSRRGSLNFRWSRRPSASRSAPPPPKAMNHVACRRRSRRAWATVNKESGAM